MQIASGLVLLFASGFRFFQVHISGYRCPNSFTDISPGFCVTYLPKFFKYCTAHFACGDLGRKHGVRLLMVGRNIKLLRVFLRNRASVFTGLNSLLFDVMSSKDQWQSTDPGYNNEPESYPWVTREPINGTEKVTVWYSDERLQSINQEAASNAVVCEVTQAPTPSQLHKELFQQNWPKPLSHFALLSENSEGCWTSSKEPTIHKCALKCHRNDYCRSLYFHPLEQWCYLALYVDSRLPVFVHQGDDSWMRFGRTQW